MAVKFWKVYDQPVVEACFLPTITLTVVTVAAVLLPQGSGIESAMESIAFMTTLVLIVKFLGAVFRRR
jgi:lysylphosphatidylglycerol synthetase-like protein (DUF2156 family)